MFKFIVLALCIVGKTEVATFGIFKITLLVISLQPLPAKSLPLNAKSSEKPGLHMQLILKKLELNSSLAFWPNTPK